MKAKDRIMIEKLRHVYGSMTDKYAAGLIILVDALEKREKEKRKYDLIVINENLSSSLILEDLVRVCEAFGYDYIAARLMNEDMLAMIIYEGDYLTKPLNLFKK